MHSSARTTPVEPDRELHLELTTGLWRRALAGILLAAGCAGGWLWLGNSGAGLLGLWAWSSYPRWVARRVTVNLSRVRFARFGVRRVFWVERTGRARQVFADEVDAAQYAALRREIKSSLSGERPSAS